MHPSIQNDFILDFIPLSNAAYQNRKDLYNFSKTIIIYLQKKSNFLNVHTETLFCRLWGVLKLCFTGT